jgi:hypothetical protein
MEKAQRVASRDFTANLPLIIRKILAIAAVCALMNIEC